MLTLDREYFNWMYKLVCGNKHYNSIAYHKLLHALHNTEFTFLIDRDKNRASDGIDLRYQFGSNPVHHLLPAHVWHGLLPPGARPGLSAGVHAAVCGKSSRRRGCH